MPFDSTLTRRDFLKGGTLAAASLAIPATLPALRRAEPGRLAARPKTPTRTATPGEHVLFEDGGRRSVLFVPVSYDAKKPAPFFLALHGATGSGDSMMRGARAPADSHGVIVLSPSSEGSSWDAIRGRFSVDIARIDQLLGEVFDRCAIDPARMAVGGFSDGATYALSVGLINGDLFTHIIAHSPGFIIPGVARGKPKVFVSHGRQDPILPIDQCGRRIVAELKRDGYSPRFDEFDGGHTASPEMRERAMGWFTGK